MKKLSIGIVRVQHLRTTQAIRSPASHPSQGIAHCRYGFHKTVPNCLAASLPAFAGAYDDQGINEYVRGGRPTFSCLIFRAQCRAKARAEACVRARLPTSFSCSCVRFIRAQRRRMLLIPVTCTRAAQPRIKQLRLLH